MLIQRLQYLLQLSLLLLCGLLWQRGVAGLKTCILLSEAQVLQLLLLLLLQSIWLII
jgi:hypothetical protein